ncbi:thiol-disulfide oxidoreductase DCC family protein [Endozoicomonas numazuensis]|uniref:thiol-disulfide oxidoreductase DCC family protein n=1 Tax=Endozoicomonas numazuensis TaxID=1137799 RepID=UPI00054D02C9|nr:DUF393 domain-containing protein [Endozoicomonas numazuensis]
MKIKVLYDGLCPLCVKEVSRWQNARFRSEVEWFDITGQEKLLEEWGIDPQKALLELHTLTDDGRVYTSIDSYALLLKQLSAWAWLGWIMSLPGLKQFLKWTYDWMTKVRLKKEGRWPGQCNSKQCNSKQCK